MSNIKVQDFSKNLFEMSEETVYNIIEKFSNNQSIDKTLTYVYIKAFYMHIVRIYLQNNKKLEKLESIIAEYKNKISIYYKSNNIGISNELLEDILNAYDRSFEILESLEFKNISDGYELRHHIVDSFELLRKILEKKSKTNIRTDLFESNISEIKTQSELILDYVASCNIID